MLKILPHDQTDNPPRDQVHILPSNLQLTRLRSHRNGRLRNHHRGLHQSQQDIVLLVNPQCNHLRKPLDSPLSNQAASLQCRQLEAGNFHSNQRLEFHLPDQFIADFVELTPKDISVPKGNLKTYFPKHLNVCLVTSIANAILFKFHNIATSRK